MLKHPLHNAVLGGRPCFIYPSQFIVGEAEKIGPSKRNHGGVYPMKIQSGYRAEQTRLKIKKVVNMN